MKIKGSFLGVFLCYFSLFSQKDVSIGQGIYAGVFKKGNFKDTISFDIKKDMEAWHVSFTSLQQNAIGIPARQVVVSGDSISFVLQSDRYTYSFKNKWLSENSELQGTLYVDGKNVTYLLKRQTSTTLHNYEAEEVSFENNALRVGGTIYRPHSPNGKALVFLSSSGGGDRSGSRAEAIYFAKKGYTTFHYDKRGTGSSEGNWQIATMEELLADDLSALMFFSKSTGISLDKIGIKGSSQGATKVPYLLYKAPSLGYGIAISCPGSSLLESDLNAWKNANREKLGVDLETASELQRKVFQYIGGILSKEDLEKAISANQNAVWFTNIWIPNLEEVVTDPKLSYSPMPYFKEIKQPLLLIQGTKDEIIPLDSHTIIAKAINPAENSEFQAVILENANHSMYYVGPSDFPYWATLHQDYLITMEDWLLEVGS